MPYLLPQPSTNSRSMYVFYDKVFSPEECDKIIALTKVLPMDNGEVFRKEGGMGVDTKVRSSKRAWIDWSAETDWIFQKLSTVTIDCNLKYYGFHLSGFSESLQLTEYTADAKGHYTWHMDLGTGDVSIRKLSLVILLSPLENFEGGELEFYPDVKAKELAQGAVICFPSWALHKVNVLTKGTRHSLVAWTSGPPFI